MSSTPPDVPFGDDDAEPAPTVSAAVGVRLSASANALDFAIATNPDEDWDCCCVCECHGDCASFDGLAYGLVLMADGTLARAAWCRTLKCAGERYASIYIPWKK